MERQIVLTEDFFISKGSQQRCYQHPADDSKCIKILYKNELDAIKQNKREIKYYTKLNKKNIKTSLLPKYYGKVNTNMGIGHVFELIKDFDGKISSELSKYLSSEEMLVNNYNAIVIALKIFKQELLKDKIIPMTLYANNILCKKNKDSTMQLIIVDDIGTAVLIPLEYYFSFFAKKRIERKLDEFRSSLIRNSSLPLIKSLIEDSGL